MKLFCAIVIIAQVISVSAQSTFINLNFEQANLAAIPQGQYGSLVPIGNGLPGWTGFLGTNQVTQVLQNNGTAGQASIDILGPDWNGVLFGSIIEGNYTVVLQAGQFNGDVAATIEQTGFVPTGTKSIQAKFGLGATDFTVTLGSQNIALVPLANGPNYTLYGGDVSSLAGQTETLSISALSDSPNNTFNTFLLDSIVFSPNPVPEPAAWTLLLCGAGLLGVMRQFRKP